MEFSKKDRDFAYLEAKWRRTLEQLEAERERNARLQRELYELRAHPLMVVELGLHSRALRLRASHEWALAEYAETFRKLAEHNAAERQDHPKERRSTPEATYATQEGTSPNPDVTAGETAQLPGGKS